MRALSLREKVLVGLCLVVLAAVGMVQLTGGGRAGGGGDLPALAKERARLAQRVKSLEQEVARLSTSRQQAVPEALRVMDRATRKAGATLQMARPLRDSVQGDLVRHAVEFGVTGRFPQVIGVLESLANEKTTMMVERVEISAADAASDQVQAQVRLAGYEPGPQSGSKRRAQP